MSSTYKTIVLAQRPKDEIVPTETFKTVPQPMIDESSLQEGQVLIELLYLSLDPTLRGQLSEGRSYVPPVGIGELMRGWGICRVVATPKGSKLSKGQLVNGSPGWREYAVVEEKTLQPINLPAIAKTTDAMGVLGITGLTAYFGMLDIGNPKPGELVVVSGAAGATGSVAVQLALIRGARVVGIAGSEDKVAWLRELGCETALNYKSASFADDFRKATDGYIDVYFDNVGGEILDLALERAKKFSRFVMCGGISQYNGQEARGPKNIINVIKMSIRMQGFIVLDYASKFAEAGKQLAQWLQEGKLQRKEHVVKGGLDQAPEALRQLFKGINTGKLLLEVKPE